MKKLMITFMLMILALAVYGQTLYITPGVYSGRPSWGTRTPELHSWRVHTDGSIDIYINNQKQGDTRYYKIEYVDNKVLLILTLGDGYSVGHYWLYRRSDSIQIVPYHDSRYTLTLYKQSN